MSQDDQGNLVRDKNIYQEQLENIQNQDDAFDFINSLQNESIPGGGFLPKSMNPQMVSQQPLFDMNNLRYIKDPLVATGAFTTDPNEERNVYQLLINKMLQGNQSQMSGAQPLSPGAVEGLRRIGPTNFVDPEKMVDYDDMAVIDSIEERNEGDLAKEILFGLESDENKNKKKEFFFF